MLVTQSCPTLGDPMDRSPPGSPVHETFQARILEWVAISFSRGSSQPRDRTRSPALQADSLPTELQGKPLLMAYYPVIIFSLSLMNSLFSELQSCADPFWCECFWQHLLLLLPCCHVLACSQLLSNEGLLVLPSILFGLWLALLDVVIVDIKMITDERVRLDYDY